MESIISDHTRMMRPVNISLLDTKPEGIKKVPADLKNVRYASFKLAEPGIEATYQVILVETDDRPSSLIVDANANGDLTDDPVVKWTSKTATDPDGEDGTRYDDAAMVTIPFKSGPKKWSIRFYQMRCDSKFDENFKKFMSCYADYGLVGEVNIDGKKIPAALADSGFNGHFKPLGEIANQPIFWLGIPQGPRNRIGMSSLPTKPFELDGKWWALADLDYEGTFRIVKSSKPADADVEPDHPAEDNLSGQKAPEFVGKLLGGGEVKFPGDYKGKVVLLDFWATWCGPCVAELPNVVNVYSKYHDQGLEVLGISLNKEGMEETLTKFTTKKKMPWKQVYDGKGWKADVATLFKIHSIPRMMLIDGNTGMVLDDGARGKELAPAIEKALTTIKK